MANWPAQLQQCLNGDSFNIGVGDTVIRSNMDVGPSKYRRRFTKSVDTLTGSIDLHKDDWDTLVDFYKVTLNGGTDYFTFKHPVTELDIEVRFTDPPQITRRGGEYFAVSLNFEIKP